MERPVTIPDYEALYFFITLFMITLFRGRSAKIAAVTGIIALTVPFISTIAAGEYMLLSPWSGTPGSTVQVTGFAYTPGTSVQVSFQGATQNVTADSGGGFTTNFTVPMRPGGSYTINGTSAQGSAQATFYIEGMFPSASPTDWWVAPGQQFGIIADNFAPSEQVQVFIGDSSSPLTSVAADTNGNIRTTNTIRAAGSYAGRTMVVRLVGVDSSASASFAVTVGGFYVHAAPTAYYATPGQTIGVTGGGFSPGEEIRILHGANLVTSVTADGSGNFSALNSITINFGATNSRTFQVVGTESNASTEFTVEVCGLFPSAVPSEYFALPGQTIGVIAGGFLPGEQVQLQKEGGAVVATATANGAGDVPGWSSVLTVPFGASGNLTYKVIGMTSNASTTFGFSVGGFDPQLDPGSWYVAPRALVSGVGRGFAPGEAVQVKVNGAVARTVTADVNGNFTTSVRAPSTGESFTFSAVGQQSGGSATRTIGMNTACIVDEE